MKSFIRLLLVTSAIILVNPLYASEESLEDSEERNLKRKIESPKHDSAQGNSEPSFKKTKTESLNELPLELMGRLPIEIITHITNYLYLDRDFSSLANLACSSRGFQHFISKEYLEAEKAFVKLDPSLEEEKAFSLWKKVYSKSQGTLEALYRDKYYAKEIEDKGNIDYREAKNISDLELFFYAQGLIRSNLDRISKVLQLPEDIDPKLDIKKRSLDLFGYLERMNSNEFLARLSSKMANAITSEIIVNKLGERGLHWRERAPELYERDQEEYIEEIGRELNLPLLYWNSFSDISFSDQQDAADWCENFYAVSQRLGKEKEQAFDNYFYHTPEGEYLSRLAENNPKIDKLFRNGRSPFTFHQKKEWLEDLERYAINKIKEMVTRNQQS